MSTQLAEELTATRWTRSADRALSMVGGAARHERPDDHRWGDPRSPAHQDSEALEELIIHPYSLLQRSLGGCISSSNLGRLGDPWPDSCLRALGNASPPSPLPLPSEDRR